MLRMEIKYNAPAPQSFNYEFGYLYVSIRYGLFVVILWFVARNAMNAIMRSR